MSVNYKYINVAVSCKRYPPSLPYIIIVQTCGKRWDLPKFVDVLSVNLGFSQSLIYIYIDIMYIHIILYYPHHANPRYCCCLTFRFTPCASTKIFVGNSRTTSIPAPTYQRLEKGRAPRWKRGKGDGLYHETWENVSFLAWKMGFFVVSYHEK